MKHFLFILATIWSSSLIINAQRSRFQFNTTHPDVHDPVMALGEDGRYYIFSTGMGIGCISSPDLKTWQPEKPVLSPIPHWATDSIRGYRGHTWAPDISKHNGLWLMYYSCSTFGKNGSAIGLAINKTLDPQSLDYKWEDLGPVIISHQHADPYNCIDPNLINSKMEEIVAKPETFAPSEKESAPCPECGRMVMDNGTVPLTGTCLYCGKVIRFAPKIDI